MATEDLSDYLYPLDTTGAAATNKVVNENQTLTPPPAPEDNDGEFTFHFIIPFAAPFYRDTLKITHITTGRVLVPGIDFTYGHKFISASFETEGRFGGIYMSVMFYDRSLSGQVRFTQYQTLGDTWTLNENQILEILSNRLVDPRTVSYEVVADKPDQFPPLPHNHPITDVTGVAEIIESNYDIAAAIRERTQDWLDNPPLVLADYYAKDEVDQLLEASDYEVTKSIAPVTGNMVIDVISADVFRMVATGNCNWTFTNRPFATNTCRFIEFRLRNGGAFTHTWPAGTTFNDGDSSLTINGLDKLVIELGPDYIDVTIIRDIK